jgi:HEAT repeat protein
MEQHKIEPSTLPPYERLLRSADTAERYWATRALLNERKPEAQDHLLGLLNDAEPIVRCQALSVLGQRAETRTMESVLAHIVTSDHWYEQWYGYGALRKLGWHQKPLP